MDMRKRARGDGVQPEVPEMALEFSAPTDPDGLAVLIQQRRLFDVLLVPIDGLYHHYHANASGGFDGPVNITQPLSNVPEGLLPPRQTVCLQTLAQKVDFSRYVCFGILKHPSVEQAVRGKKWFGLAPLVVGGGCVFEHERVQPLLLQDGSYRVVSADTLDSSFSSDVVTAFYGESGSGKTLSLLRLSHAKRATFAFYVCPAQMVVEPGTWGWLEELLSSEESSESRDRTFLENFWRVISDSLQTELARVGSDPRKLDADVRCTLLLDEMGEFPVVVRALCHRCGDVTKLLSDHLGGTFHVAIAGTGVSPAAGSQRGTFLAVHCAVPAMCLLRALRELPDADGAMALPPRHVQRNIILIVQMACQSALLSFKRLNSLSRLSFDCCDQLLRRALAVHLGTKGAVPPKLLRPLETAGILTDVWAASGMYVEGNATLDMQWCIDNKGPDLAPRYAMSPALRLMAMSYAGLDVFGLPNSGFEHEQRVAGRLQLAALTLPFFARPTAALAVDLIRPFKQRAPFFENTVVTEMNALDLTQVETRTLNRWLGPNAAFTDGLMNKWPTVLTETPDWFWRDDVDDHLNDQRTRYKKNAITLFKHAPLSFLRAQREALTAPVHTAPVYGVFQQGAQCPGPDVVALLGSDGAVPIVLLVSCKPFSSTTQVRLDEKNMDTPFYSKVFAGFSVHRVHVIHQKEAFAVDGLDVVCWNDDDCLF